MLLFYGEFREKSDMTSASLPTGHATNDNRTQMSREGEFALAGRGEKGQDAGWRTENVLPGL